MLDCLPERIEPVGLADAGRSFRGEVPVSELKRLRPALSSTNGVLRVELEFRRDERHIRIVAGHIEGNVDLVCQRCLETLRFPLDIDFRLGIVGDNDEVDRLPDGYEPILVTGEPLQTFDVIEDEVLLAIPVIPLHEGVDSCDSGYVNKPRTGKENPFAVLEKLKL